MYQAKRGLVFLVLLATLMMVCSSGGTEEAADINDGETNSGLTFSAAELTTEPTLVDWVQDGTTMQLIARKDEAGAVRLAFNTCQACGGSPYAWFEYLGNNTLQCQNCGLIFPLDSAGTTRTAGCNPVTITEFTVKGDTVNVPQSVLADNVKRFANWKKIPK